MVIGMLPLLVAASWAKAQGVLAEEV